MIQRRIGLQLGSQQVSRFRPLGRRVLSVEFSEFKLGRGAGRTGLGLSGEIIFRVGRAGGCLSLPVSGGMIEPQIAGKLQVTVDRLADSIADRRVS